MRPALNPFGVFLLVCACAAAPAVAQPNSPYEIVDPGMADSSALGESFRLVPYDLRTPTGFDTVFRLPTVTGSEMFARIDGGLTAVFPRSVYAFGQAIVPAGTTYYIGQLPPSLLGLTPKASPGSLLQSVSTRLDLRARTPDRRSPESIAARLAPVRNPLMPWSGELERAGRIALLLNRAALVELEGVGGQP